MLRRAFAAGRRLVAWWIPVWVLAVSLVLAGLAFAGWWIDPLNLSGTCKDEAPLGCGISLNLVATLVVVSIGYFGLFFRQRNAVIRSYLDDVSGKPARLFQGAGGGAEELVLDSRKQTRDDVINVVNAASRPDPVLIVGDAGVGKTALLAAIAKELARRKRLRWPGPPSRRVPVPVALRAGDSIDFDALARRSFLDEVGHELDSPQQAGAIWRKVRRSLGIVVLVDGLDQVQHISKSARDERLREALAAAAEDRIAVVMSVRPRGVPETIRSRAFALEHFDEKQLTRYLEERLRSTAVREGRLDGDGRSARSWRWVPGWLRGLKDRLAAMVVRDAAERAEAKRRAEAELVERAASIADQVEVLADATGLEALRTPFYLDVMAMVGPDPNAEAARACGRVGLQRRVLDRYVGAIRTKAMAAGMTEPAVARMVDALEEMAPQMLVDEGELEPSAVIDPDGGLYNSALTRSERRNAVASALDLGLLERAGPVECIRFREPSLNAYFAARRFQTKTSARFGNPLWRRTVSETTSEEMMLALALFAVEADGETANTISEELLGRDDIGLDPDHDLRLARTVAEIARARDLKGLFPRIATAACRPAAADRLQKLRLFRVIAELRDDDNYRTLFEYARAAGPFPIEWGDFVLRWAASKQLVVGRHDAYGAIAGHIDDAITEVENTASDASQRECAIIGWILPGMRERDGSATDGEIDDRLERLLALALDRARFHETGMQNALARGFKIDALSRRQPTVDPLVLDRFLPAATFWHARVCLVHAIAIPCFDPATRDAAAWRQLGLLALGRDGGPANPMVRQAARLCRNGINGGEPKDHYIWEAEGHATSQASEALTDESAQLVADVAILMNLIYSKKAEAAAREEGFADPVVTDIPHCLATSRKRSELFKTCPDCCLHNLCPFPESAVREMVRGEVSQAFCRRQSEIAARQRPPWHPGIRRRTLGRFWQDMEREKAAMGPLLQWWETMTPPDAATRAVTAHRHGPGSLSVR